MRAANERGDGRFVGMKSDAAAPGLNGQGPPVAPAPESASTLRAVPAAAADVARAWRARSRAKSRRLHAHAATRALHAPRLAERGLATVITEAELNAGRLAETVDTVLAAPLPPAHGLDLNGARNTAKLLLLSAVRSA